MAVNYFAGYSGIVRAGGVDLNVTEFKVGFHNATIDTSNTSTNGFESWIAGLTGADYSCSAYWDANDSPTANSPGLTPGAIVSFTFNLGTTGKTTSFSGIVDKLDLSSDVHGGVKYDLSGKSTGTVNFPN